MISISIVSHMQMDLIVNLLDDIERACISKKIEVILTLNANEYLDTLSYSYPLSIIKNDSPKGFGANHNQAFKLAKGKFFCVMNPDIRLNEDPFPALLNGLEVDTVGVISPIIMNDSNLIEDSARLFPSPISIFFKLVNKLFNRSVIGTAVGNEAYEWVGGMFMLFTANTYKLINGFDERYFMYYEDVDICARLTNMGKQVVLCQSTSVIHLAQRASHRSMKHLRWHLNSMLRFFFSKAYWCVLWR
jgi:N-acetylglucosaminyl-diphospho-decaprenol L-rhamnosyltransferase